MFKALGGPDAPAATEIPINEGRASLRLQRPPSTPAKAPAIFHIHAGGGVSGTAAMCDGLNWRRALDHGAVVASLEYRLAPETNFPGPLEDAYAGLVWIAAQAESLDIDPARIVLLGESAGGGLAATLALLARDHGGPAIAAQVLAYPMLDYLTGGPDDPREHGHGGAYFWPAGSNHFGWNAQRGETAIGPDQLGYFSALHAQSYANLPPTFIAVGGLDLLFDEALDFARRLTHAGNPVDLQVYASAFHNFDVVRPAAVTQRFLADLSAALDRGLAARGVA
ncbi:alpha/beta hydrolase [Phenylobacterium sp.]|uniref:alpha/beta hydrolase n=1 Tax=Phenylobacterium sp. TaxID=1871053 RepID=UPI0035B45CFB